LKHAIIKVEREKNVSKKKGSKFEDKVQKCINSGSLWFDKGDLKTEDYLIESKFTEKKAFRITTKILQKLWEEALDRNKLPALVRY
jgi:hypothetical protein